MTEISDKLKKAYSIPPKRKYKSRWCTGFIVGGDIKDAATLCRDEALRKVKRNYKRFSVKRYNE